MDKIRDFVKRKVPENKLREIRQYEGLSQSRLAGLASVTVETIREAENRRRKIKRSTQILIVEGLNNNPKKVNKNQTYTLEDVFPNG